MRAIILLASISILTAAVCFVLLLHPKAGNVTTGLSDRSKEFIKDQSSQGTGSWSVARLEPTPADRVSKMYQTSCFRVQIESTIGVQSVDEVGCRIIGKLLTPMVHLSIGAHVGRLDEDASVMLRLRSSQYHEVEHTPSRLVFTGDREATLFEQRGNRILTISYSDIPTDPVEFVQRVNELSEQLKML